MIIALIILLVTWGIPMILYIVWKRGDWYLFLFLMFSSFFICFILSVISDVLSICFAIIIAIYFIKSITNKNARRISNEIKIEKQEIFEKYKREEVDNQLTFKNFVLLSGQRVDFIDFNTKTFYLLRPYSEDVDTKYKKQVKKYKDELEELYGGNWKSIIDTY